MFLRNHHAVGDGLSISQAYSSMSPDHKTFKAELGKKLKHTKSLTFRLSYLWWLIWGIFPTILLLLQNIWMGKDKTPYNREKLTPHKEINAIWADDAFDIYDVHRIRRKYGVTLNDFFIAIASATITEYFDIKNPRFCRVGMPINVRFTPVANQPSNKFGASGAKIPIGEMSFKKRCDLVKRGTKLMKLSPIHHYGYYAAKFSFLVPGFIIRFVVKRLCLFMSFNQTNVMGPPKAIHLVRPRPSKKGRGKNEEEAEGEGDVITSEEEDEEEGMGSQEIRKRVVKIINGMCFVPLPFVGFGFAVTSYGERVMISMVADRDVVDTTKFLDIYKRKFVELLEEEDDEEN